MAHRLRTRLQLRELRPTRSVLWRDLPLRQRVLLSQDPRGLKESMNNADAARAAIMRTWFHIVHRER